MARKTNILKTLREARNQESVGDRQPMPPTTALYLAQLRPRVLKVPSPRPRQQIAIQIEEPPQPPCMLKIIHADSI
jgi:hypothetical protein